MCESKLLCVWVYISTCVGLNYYVYESKLLCVNQSYYLCESKLLCVWVYITVCVSPDYYVYFVHYFALYLLSCSRISCNNLEGT